VRLRNSFLLFQDSRLYYQNLIEQAENIWDVLASDKETVESFQDTNEALVGHRTAEILRTLTVFSVIIFLLTLITALASLTFSASPRFARSAIFLEGFMIIFFGVILAMLVYFRRRRWL
jgi:Mg2+ and Co2+ transporter CorA